MSNKVTSLIDKDQRSQAIHPFESFIVQAPAGSGKTEILTQRFLRLLSTVSSPEQIIALTFTRKAASEMRARVLLALQQAENNQPARSSHQEFTLQLAKQALDRSHHLKWNLLDQPNRLRISTMDSLCQSICQSIPLLEKQIALAQITNTPNHHYLHAARNCLQHALETPEFQSAIKILLLHLDNRQDKLLDLLSNLLSQRDQWLSPLFQARVQEKALFEHALKCIETHEIEQLHQSLPWPLAADLVSQANALARIENNPDSPRYLLTQWSEFKEINTEMAGALSALLLTGQKEFRKAFDHHVGLKKGSCPDQQFTELKTKSKALLNQLGEYPDFLHSLIQVSHLPAPEYQQEQWEVLQALFTLLPLLAGHLHLQFSEHHEVDFTAISQHALHALGEEDNPTDLALYLDHSIQHLLVDEFQDTSITQFELLSQLVQGWQTGDGRTLFLVGDPMQSIYRFRQAEVGLFLQAKEQGMGPLRLIPLALSCNFRSTNTLITWVNQQFKHIFPSQFDMESGAVSFHPSVHVINTTEPSRVLAIQYKNKTQEAKHLIEKVVEELQTHPNQSIAILVRSRSHLTEIIRQLRRQRIPYQGSDMDLLSHLPHVRDVWSLTQALLFPANRLAWLALLHSPFGGLSLADMHQIAQFNISKSLLYALQHLNEIKHLTEEGFIRAQYVAQVMTCALTQRHQTLLSDWVANTLTALQSDKLLHQNQKNDIEQFFNLVDLHEEQGRITDIKAFTTELNHLYSQQTTPARLQVMTIHKSKGLEFDTVFLPGMGSQPKRQDKPLLRWLKLPSHQQGSIFLVSPVQATHSEPDALYHYLSRIEEEKNAYELQRLLYVAATRARFRLYLFDHSIQSSKGSFKSLLKNQPFMDFNGDDEEKINTTRHHPKPQLVRLPLTHYTKAPPFSIPTAHQAPPLFSTGLQRLIGIATHHLLHWICENHPNETDQIPWHLAQHQLTQMGIDGHARADAEALLKKQIQQLFNDPIGQWIIRQQEEEKNEYQLLIELNGRLVTRVMDRTFVANNTRWVIDFKTGQADKETIIAHEKQLNDYAFYLSNQTTKPIQCGLYYLHSSYWHHWCYQP